MGVDIFQKTKMDIEQTHTRGNQIRAVMTAVQQTETDDLKYCDSPPEALIEFTIMALCNIYIGTAGSTVRFIVQAWNVKCNSKNFAFIETSGNWHVPDYPTMKLRQHIAESCPPAGCPHPPPYSGGGERTAVDDLRVCTTFFFLFSWGPPGVRGRLLGSPGPEPPPGYFPLKILIVQVPVGGKIEVL